MGLRPLLDLRFADDFLLCAKSFSETATLLDSLVQSFADVGLHWNANKTLVLTTQAQPPSIMKTNAGIELQIVDRDACHRWLGCMFTAGGSKQHCQDVRLHLTQAAKAFFANRWVLRDKIKNVSLGARLRFFQSVVTPVACFASGYRTVRSQDLQAMNVEFRTLLRSIVGPPQNIVWEAPWHEVLHEWNERARRLEDRHCVLDWGFVALRHYWKLARYVAHLPEDRWVRRLLDWKPCGRKKVGRPFFTWESKLEEFCRHKYLGPWQSAASDLDFWHGLMDDFVGFCL